MAVQFGPLAYVNNLTRGIMDDMVNMKMLAESNTALYLMMRNPITQAGAYLQANITYKRKRARVTSTGTALYDKTIDPPHITGREQWTRVQLEYAIDGFNFEAQTGRDIQDVDGGMSIPRGSARQFVNAYAEEMRSARGDFMRDLNRFIIEGGTVASADQGQFGAEEFIGLRQLSATTEPTGGRWGGLTEANFASGGTHNFKGIDPQGANQKFWSPVFKDSVGALNLKNGDLDNMMRVLNHGASQIAPSQAFEATFVGLMSQTTRAMIIGALGDSIQRNLNEGGGANTDVTGMRRPIRFDEYNLMLYADSIFPEGEIIVWNPACIRLAQINGDNAYVKNWFMSTTNNTAVLPFRKMCQLWCEDVSQIGRLSGITSVTRS